MKKFLIIHFFVLICVEIIYCQDYIEPQWKFYLAFEDATNAKDTLWLVLDSSATFWSSLVPPYMNGWDPQFGEIPVELNEGVFNVWTYNYEEPFNPNPPKFKVVAYPIHFTPGATIYANNYILPIKLSWDTTLFNSPVLQTSTVGPICDPVLGSDYFFGISNWHSNVYSMLFNTHVLMPAFNWGSQNQFPFGVGLERGHNCDPLSAISTSLSHQLVLYPNPCVDELRLRSAALLRSVHVYNLQGQELMQKDIADITGVRDELRIDVASLPHGMYVLHTVAADGSKWSGKFVVSR